MVDISKTADGFVQNAVAKPAGCFAVGKNQIGRDNSNPNLVEIRSVVHEKTTDGSACVANADCRRVGDARCKINGDWYSADYSRASRYSLLVRFDVYQVVRAGKQGRKIEKLVDWCVSGVNMWTRSSRLPRVSNVEVLDASDATAVICGVIASKIQIVWLALSWLE